MVDSRSHGAAAAHGTTSPSRAWAVLAVALALMALVSALSATSGTGHHDAAGAPGAADTATSSGSHAGRGHGGAPMADPHHLAAPDSGAGAAPTTTTTSTTPSGTRPPTQGSSPAAATSLGSPATVTTTATAQPATDGAATTPRTVDPAATPTSQVQEPAARYPGVGNIAPPTVSAAYPAPGGGIVDATATWSTTAVLVLSIACPGGLGATRSGTSPLSLSVDDTAAAGTCTVTLGVPGPEADGVAVSYTLSIEPAPAT